MTGRRPQLQGHGGRGSFLPLPSAPPPQAKSSSRSPRTTSFSGLRQQEVRRRRRRLDAGLSPNGGAYPTSFEDRPKPRAVTASTEGARNAAASQQARRESSSPPAAVAPATNFTATSKMSFEEEPAASLLPPTQTPLFASRSTFLYADREPAEGALQQPKSQYQRSGVVEANLPLSEPLDAALTSSSTFLSTIKQEKAPMDASISLQKERHSPTAALEAAVTEHPSSHTIVVEDAQRRQQHDVGVYCMLPVTHRRWSNSPVYDIVAHAPSTQASTRAPSATSAIQALPVPPAPKQRGNLPSPAWKLEKVEADNVKEHEAPAGAAEARSTEKVLDETRRQHRPSALRRPQPPPGFPHVGDEVEAVGRRVYAGAELKAEAAAVTDRHHDQLAQPKNPPTPQPRDGPGEVERTPPWEVVAQVEAVQEIVRRARQTEVQRDEEMVRYLRPEERLLWRSLKQNLASLHAKSSELTARICEWEKRHSADTLARVEKRLRLVQSKRQLLLMDWEKVEDLSWEYLTSQLLYGARKELGAVSMPPHWQMFQK
ncbi:uncharacterized protein Tco025E_05803 [Trypanosoma conorhini]|uniref:Uncharacterized protein n=1 Tax=Trypanosoma conorhini TaxID=83891 RepID=A0A3R7LHM8_9TRYP|nr:uncharacterized protein Tco025E_05803 [Trypanosoma conorhini]RNF14626.1 hypothetical protein Tco025E_05803 [Trypanosoma conorhini]